MVTICGTAQISTLIRRTRFRKGITPETPQVT
ncbi:hypothetical protein TMEN_6959 [Trichophyton mentagrophytes]|nr:hypothetical protein TMEN_6959 [Trichophyton mentagrophytes]